MVLFNSQFPVGDVLAADVVPSVYIKENHSTNITIYRRYNSTINNNKNHKQQFSNRNYNNQLLLFGIIIALTSTVAVSALTTFVNQIRTVPVCINNNNCHNQQQQRLLLFEQQYHHHRHRTTTRKHSLLPFPLNSNKLVPEKHRQTSSSSSYSLILSSSPSSIEEYEQNNDQNVKDDISIVSSNSTSNRIDEILSKLTTGFPFFVLSAAIIAIVRPQLLVWVNNGSIISIMLALVMCGTGLTLEVSDFTNVLRTKIGSIPLGIGCQFCIMPIASFLVGLLLLYKQQQQPYGYDLFIGLLLVGCAPGGTASNLVALIAQANVALSVLLTTCSTIMAVFVTPFLVTTLLSVLQKVVSLKLPILASVSAGATATSTATATSSSASTIVSTGGPMMIKVSGIALCAATAKVVFIPVLTGMVLRGIFPALATIVSRYTPFASVILVSLLCGGVVAQNVQMLATTTTATATTVVPSIVVAVLLVHTIGFITGYIIPRYLFNQEETTSRTISIEVGMQNSALAVVLARSIPGLHPIASLPGAFSATAHSCLGSILATIWRRISLSKDKQKTNQQQQQK